MHPIAGSIALACMLAVAVPAIAAERGWDVELRAGHIEGPGMTNKQSESLRRIDGIKDSD